MGWMEFILSILTLLLGTGWLFTYRAYRRKANGEATQAEADGWKAQQEVYQTTIHDLKESCEYIRNDRNLLREENAKLRAENDMLREKINKMEDTIADLREKVARLGRQLDTITSKRNNKEKYADTKER